LRRRRPWGTLVELHLFDNMKAKGKPRPCINLYLKLPLRRKYFR
jgi:hypothetical protein